MAKWVLSPSSATRRRPGPIWRCITTITGWMRPLDRQERETFYCDTFCLQDLIDAIEQDKNPVLSMARHRHIVEIMNTIPRCIETGCIQPLSTTFSEEDTDRG